MVQKAVWWTSLSFFASFFSRRESLNVCQHNQVQFCVEQFQAVVQIKQNGFHCKLIRALNTFWSSTTSTSIINKLLYLSNDIFLFLHMEIHLNSSRFCSFAMRWCQWLPRLCISISCLRAEESSARTTEPETNDTKLEVYAVLSFLLYFTHVAEMLWFIMAVVYSWNYEFQRSISNMRESTLV